MKNLKSKKPSNIELNDNISELNELLLSLEEELFTLHMISDKVNKNPNRLEMYRLIPEMVGKKSFENTLVNQIEKLNKLLENKDDLLRELCVSVIEFHLKYN